MTNINKYNRLSLGFLPTPLTLLPRLSTYLDGPKIYIKRDDCTGLAGGGNKVRKLEFLLAHALEQGADTIITQGAVQSNHARQTAAASARLGLECYVLLEDRHCEQTPAFYTNGNVFLDQLFGAKVHRYPGGTDMNQMMALKAHTLSESGRKPYIIPGGGSNAIGGLGYVKAAQEILDDANQQNITFAHIIHATGSSGTQAGLVAGLHHLNHTLPVTGISVRFPKDQQHQKVYGLSQEIVKMLNCEHILPAEGVQIDDRFIGQGYGIPDEGALNAITLFARLEGIILDPVYTGKGAAGLIQLIKEGRFTKADNVLFLHTGGAQSISGFCHYFDFPAVENGMDG